MHRMWTKRVGSWSNDRDKARSGRMARQILLSSPLLSVVLLLRAYSYATVLVDATSVTVWPVCATCSRTHPMALLVILSLLTRAPASEWAGFFVARVGGPRYKVQAVRAACGRPPANDARSVGLRTVRKPAPEGPRTTRCLYAIHRSAPSTCSCRVH